MSRVERVSHVLSGSNTEATLDVIGRVGPTDRAMSCAQQSISMAGDCLSRIPIYFGFAILNRLPKGWRSNAGFFIVAIT